jgi:hypothetical protein
VQLTRDAAELIAWYRERTERARRQRGQWRSTAAQLQADNAELRQERDDARHDLAQALEANTLLRHRLADLEATKAR